jgi:hypothetical protein
MVPAPQNLTHEPLSEPLGSHRLPWRPCGGPGPTTRRAQAGRRTCVLVCWPSRLRDPGEPLRCASPRPPGALAPLNPRRHAFSPTPRRPARPTPTRAVGYVRVSTEEQADEGVSLDARRPPPRLLRLRGLELAAVYRDEGVSGGKAFGARPAGAALAPPSPPATRDTWWSPRSTAPSATPSTAWAPSRRGGGAGVALHLVDMGGQAVDTAPRWAASSAHDGRHGRVGTGDGSGAHQGRPAAQAARGERLGRDPLGLATPAPGTP